MEEILPEGSWRKLKTGLSGTAWGQVNVVALDFHLLTSKYREYKKKVVSSQQGVCGCVCVWQSKQQVLGVEAECRAKLILLNGLRTASLSPPCTSADLRSSELRVRSGTDMRGWSRVGGVFFCFFTQSHVALTPSVKWAWHKRDPPSVLLFTLRLCRPISHQQHANASASLLRLSVCLLVLSEDEQIVFSPVCEVQVGRQACIPPFRTLTDYNLSLWFSLAPSCSLNVYIYIFLVVVFLFTVFSERCYQGCFVSVWAKDAKPVFSRSPFGTGADSSWHSWCCFFPLRAAFVSVCVCVGVFSPDLCRLSTLWGLSYCHIVFVLEKAFWR